MGKQNHLSRMLKIFGILSVGTLLALTSLQPLYAQQMRGFDEIPKREKLPEGAEAVENIEQVARGSISDGIDEMKAAWNDQNIDELLSDDFQGKQRLSDALVTNVPSQSEMVIENIRGVSTLQQMITTDENGVRQRVSTVTTTVQSSLRVQDPTEGLVSVPGVNEIIFEVVEILE